MIDRGSELFGNATRQLPSHHANGFLALAEFDKRSSGGNENGMIESDDAIFPLLRLWQDANHDGRSEANELLTLSSAGIAALDLDYKEARRRDEQGNQFKYRAKVTDHRGAQAGRWAWDVILMVER
jgi:hypothetical protein